MRDELISFQQTAVSKLLAEINSAVAYHRVDGRPQVIAFRAPTGSGKTIVMTTVIEDILNGTETTVEQPEAIFVWLSDSPQLNEQSKTKIITKADKIRPNQCVTIDDDSFDQELLDDGMIYFLNTQKLGKSSRLVSGGDSRTYTIWQTLQNTIEQKGDHIYVIIDEAHRGMHDREAAKATTIMQKFLKGSEPDGLSPMPIVIGMSATDERFRRLVGNISSVRHDVDVRPDEVRSSGLLKDRIIITYPEQESIDDMVILQAAADEWKDKCEHWNYYCETQHSQQVRPVLVIQVENRNSDSASATEIGECLSRIEARTGARFSEYEVVHTFGQTADIEAGGLKIHHVEASDIADNKKIRVVFFKENLSTGWDCPRAETMMSFRHAQDATYIAQLLGRMIRTPLQRYIDVDETLNEVRLFLPHFNKDNVESVMKALQDEEGSDIPADVEGESYGNDSRETWGYRPRNRRQPAVDPNQMTLVGYAESQGVPVDPLFENQQSETNSDASEGTTQTEPTTQLTVDRPDTNIDSPSVRTVATHQNPDEGVSAASQTETPQALTEPEPEQLAFIDGIDREAIAAFINRAALITYEIKPFKTTDYLPSLVTLASLIKNTGLDPYALHSVQQDGIKLIEEYIGKLKENNEYEVLAAEVKKLNLSWKIFDAFGKAIDRDKEYTYYTSSDEDIDRKFRIAERILGGFGLGASYGVPHFNPDNPSEYMVHVILFAADRDCVDKLHLYAKDKFNELSDAYRLQFALMTSDKYRKQYDAIISNGNEVSAHSFHLPEQIRPIVDQDGEKYYNHFFVNEEVSYAKIKLDSWEKAVIDEESKRDDFVCWIRNPSTPKGWGLCLQRLENGIVKGFYPDFIIIRNVTGIGYVIDILEPHRADLTDNLSKAKALADYAQKQPTAPIGRLQLIREGKDNITGKKRMKRLDLAKSAVRARVMQIQTTQELDNLFLDDSLVD